MTTDQANKTINHIQKVFYVVGGLNAFLAISAISSTFFSIGLAFNALIGVAIIFMGWSLKQSYKHYIPNTAFILSALLLILNIIGQFYDKKASLLGLIFPFALWIIGKQAKQAILIIENEKNIA